MIGIKIKVQLESQEIKLKTSLVSPSHLAR
jgi:hypothetical protein